MASNKPGRPFAHGHDPRRATNNSPKIVETRAALKRVRELAARNADEAILTLLALMRGNVQLIQYKAAVEMLQWAFGRPSTWTEIESGIPADVSKLPKPEQTKLLRARLTQYSDALAILESTPEGTVVPDTDH